MHRLPFLFVTLYFHLNIFVYHHAHLNMLHVGTADQAMDTSLTYFQRIKWFRLMYKAQCPHCVFLLSASAFCNCFEWEKSISMRMRPPPFTQCSAFFRRPLLTPLVKSQISFKKSVENKREAYFRPVSFFWDVFIWHTYITEKPMCRDRSAVDNSLLYN